MGLVCAILAYFLEPVIQLIRKKRFETTNKSAPITINKGVKTAPIKKKNSDAV
jgi:hypothetical protein